MNIANAELKLTLSEWEQQGLESILAEGYTVERSLSASEKVRGIVRGYRTTIDKLRENPWNPNVMGDRTMQAVGESLAEFGQVTEIIVRHHPDEPQAFQTVDGAHRSRSMTGTVAVNILYGYSEPELKKMTIALNELSGKADRIELAKLLKSIEADFGDDLGEALPYSSNEMGDILKLANLDWDNDGELEGGSEPEPKNKDDGWVNLKVSIPQDVHTLFEMAIDSIRAQRKNLHKTPAIAHGQVLEVLVAEYMASVQLQDES